MGFITGFTGGVTLTLSLAYYFVYTNQNNRLKQSLALRTATHSLNFALSPSARPPLSLSRLDAAAAIRPGLVAELKDKWNAELGGVVRRVQTADWDGMRDDAEAFVMRLWHGQDWKPSFRPEAWAQAARPQDFLQSHSSSPMRTTTPPAQASYNQPKDPPSHEQQRQQHHSLSDRLHDAKEAVVDKVHHLQHATADKMATAKAKVHMVEEKWEGKAERKLLQMDEVERTLQERYDSKGRHDHMKKDVEDTLKERLKHNDEKETAKSRMRGV